MSQKILFEIFKMKEYFTEGVYEYNNKTSRNGYLKTRKDQNCSSREANSFAFGKLLAIQYGEFEQTSVHILRQNKVTTSFPLILIFSFLGTRLMKVSVCTTNLRGPVFLDDCAATSLQGQTPLLTSFWLDRAILAMLRPIL